MLGHMIVLFLDFFFTTLMIFYFLIYFLIGVQLLYSVLGVCCPTKRITYMCTYIPSLWGSLPLPCPPSHQPFMSSQSPELSCLCIQQLPAAVLYLTVCIVSADPLLASVSTCPFSVCISIPGNRFASTIFMLPLRKIGETIPALCIISYSYM